MGAMHAPYAIFAKTAQLFNGGKKIGLICAADTRMAGYFYAFHRLLRLKAALESTIASVEFQSLNLSKPFVLKSIAFLKNRDMWDALHCVTRCLFPALRVLRLADKSEPGFDCLNFFIRKAECAMEWSTLAFESVEFFTNTITNPAVLNDISNSYEDRREEDIDEYADMVAEGLEEDGEGYSDDDSRLDLNVGVGTGRDFGQNIITLWNKRKGQMVSDYAIAGWLLSPLEDVMIDVKNGRTRESNEAMDRILNKQYHNLTEDELGMVKDKFWTEFNEFSTKTGRFGGGRRYIWNSELLRKRHSAKWHGQYSVAFTEVRWLIVFCLLSRLFLTASSCCSCAILQVLGKVACRILSTLLGIGVAERSWGAVKHLKSGSRSHLGADATRMQATIFGAACIEKARALKAEKELSMELWNDNDIEFQLGLENFTANEAQGVVQQGQAPRRLFHTWREDWEQVSSKMNDCVHETKLLRKYGGLRWLDPDSNNMFVAETDNMEWRRGLGWCVIAIREDGEMEPWPVKLLPSLIKHTKQETRLNVEYVNLSREEKAKRKAEREAAWAATSNGGGKSKGKKGNKRRRYDSDSDSDDSEK